MKFYEIIESIEFGSTTSNISKNKQLSESTLPSELIDEIAELRRLLTSQEELAKADRAHAKSQYDKLKYIAINSLQDNILPLISNASHALNKEVPKINVAKHHLLLILDDLDRLISTLSASSFRS